MPAMDNARHKARLLFAVNIKSIMVEKDFGH
jgi:hypothetical protein